MANKRRISGSKCSVQEKEHEKLGKKEKTTKYFCQDDWQKLTFYKLFSNKKKCFLFLCKKCTTGEATPPLESQELKKILRFYNEIIWKPLVTIQVRNGAKRHTQRESVKFKKIVADNSNWRNCWDGKSNWTRLS